MEAIRDFRPKTHPAIPTALIIDDEPLIRRLVRRILEPDICRVVEAENGEAGLAIIQRDAPPIDIVLTDIRMPGLSGWDVAEALVRFRPEIPIGVISAHDDTGAASELAERLGTRLLVKPFTATSLSALAVSLVGAARVARDRTDVWPGRPRQAYATNQIVRRRIDLRATRDLVAAAWEVHRRFRHGDL